MKKSIALLITFAMVLSLCACANKGESNSAFDEAQSEVQNAENEAATEEVTEVSAVPADPEMMDNSAAEENAPVFIETSADNGYVFIYWNDDCLNELKDGEKELWLRLYKNENREEGYEISTSDIHWTFAKLGLDGVLFEDNAIEKNGDEWKWIMIYSDFWADMADCTYYEAIMNDVKNSDNRGLVADGKIEIKLPESEETQMVEKSENSDAKAADYWYIDNTFRDALGHEFTFSVPDEKGYPTKITISNYSDDCNGTHDFEADSSTDIRDKNQGESWICGKISDIPGVFTKKDMLVDNNDVYLGIFIYN